MAALRDADRRRVPERRKAQRRKLTDPVQIPEGIERRGGKERRGAFRRVADRAPKDLFKELEVLSKLAGTPQGEKAFRQVMVNAAYAIASMFAVGEEEVAILLLKGDGAFLRFAYPIRHYEGQTNFFPITAPGIATDVLRTRKGRIDNDLSQVRHQSIYERIPVTERKTRDIQKMLTVPLLLPDGKATGVVEVSKKGASSEEAGKNFAPEDLTRLTQLCTRMAPYFVKLLPPKF